MGVAPVVLLKCTNGIIRKIETDSPDIRFVVCDYVDPADDGEYVPTIKHLNIEVMSPELLQEMVLKYTDVNKGDVK